jgi:redox-sensitive bicupin YhaK (pirin superfamily)
MTAGKGIQHAEMFPLLHTDQENPLELLQVWINLPAKSKFVEPYYKMLWSEDIPIVEMDDHAGRKSRILVIAGKYNGTNALSPTPDSWAADPANEVEIWIAELEPGAILELPPAAGIVTRSLYYYYGDGLTINGQEMPGKHQARIHAGRSAEIVNGDAPSTFLVLQGKPIAEPVAQYGPFVMNTRSEIQQAYQDYTETSFGGWPWNRQDPVHGSEPRRFAKYIDGSEEKK